MSTYQFMIDRICKIWDENIKGKNLSFEKRSEFAKEELFSLMSFYKTDLDGLFKKTVKQIHLKEQKLISKKKG